MNELCIHDGVMHCPHCGSMYLHHGPVRVFDRSEDAEMVTRTEVRPGGEVRVKVVPNNRNNPSARRGGLTIEFSCESCGRASFLGVAQHKGCTEIEWRG